MTGLRSRVPLFCAMGLLAVLALLPSVSPGFTLTYHAVKALIRPCKRIAAFEAEDLPGIPGQAIVQDILHIHFQDNVQARRLRPDGSYERLSPPPNIEGICAQDWLLQHWKTHSESFASPAQPRPSRGEQVPSGLLPVPETDMTTPFTPPLPCSNGDSL